MDAAKRHTRIWMLVVLGLACVAARAAVDVTTLVRADDSRVAVATSYKSFNRVTREATYDVTVTNTSASPLVGPVYLVVDALTGQGVTVHNAGDMTAGGQPVFLLKATPIAPGERLVQSVVLGNPSNVRLSFVAGVYSSPPPLTVIITKPATLITVGSTPLAIEGTVSDPAATLTVNGVPITNNAGAFKANVALVEGHNAVVARAVSGGQEATGVISVSLDLTPPYITIESPVDGATVTTRLIAVSGLINDIVRGTVSDGQANVTVNGKAATVSNRTYLARDVELVEGANTLTVQASDQVGNTNAVQVNVIYTVPEDKHIEEVSGQNQHGQIRSALARPLSVKLLGTGATPQGDTPVVFRVIEGDGEVGVGGPDQGQAVLVNTDAQGIASTSFKLGSRAGNGNNRVVAKAVGFQGQVEFFASADPNPGDKVSVNSGNNQRGAANQPLALPFVVAVTDDGANVVKDAQIEFKVTAGGGSFQNGLATYTTTTDSDGRASASFVLGSEAGLDAQRVTATLVGTSLYAGFAASALATGDPGQTSISGVVLDNQDQPLPGVTVRVEGTNRQASTDDAGQFKITEVPVGPVHLLADGSTTSVPGEWPTLPYNLVTIAGADNPLPAPIYMVKLDKDGAVWVGKEDRVITVPGLPGFEFTVKKDSVTFPNGDREGYVSVTPVNASKVPMAPPNGMQPQLIVTIQPTGATFDPPAPLQLPNVDGHPPGAQVDMYSFDHDLEEFVSIGLGTVSADGTVIRSNEGVGVVKAGWHCGSQPGGGGCAHSCPTCQKCDGNCNCTPDDGQQPGECKKCSGGSPVPDDAATPTSVTDTAGDCKKPACKGGAATEEADDGDKPTREQNQDAPCKKCENKSLVKDETQETKACGVGETQACWTCKEGACGNHCNASKEKIVNALSGGVFDEALGKLTGGITKAISKVRVFGRVGLLKPSFDLKVTGQREDGWACCQDCRVPPDDPEKGWKATTFKASVKAEGSVTLGLSASDLAQLSVSRILLGYRFFAGVTDLPNVQLAASASGSGSAQNMENCLTDSCGELAANFQLKAEGFAGAGAGLSVDELKQSGALYCRPSGAQYIKNFPECWASKFKIVGKAGTSLEANLLSVEPKYVFAANPKTDCGSKGFTCKGNALKSTLKAAYEFAVNLFFYKGTYSDTAEVDLTDGASFDCSF